MAKRIIRIILTIPVFAITAFLSILAESRADYLTPISDVYESWALAAFFLMLSSYISPVSEEREKILQEREKLGMYNVRIITPHVQGDKIIETDEISGFGSSFSNSRSS